MYVLAINIRRCNALDFEKYFLCVTDLQCIIIVRYICEMDCIMCRYGSRMT